MSLPKIGSILEKKNMRTGRWAPTYILLGSRHPNVFLLNRTGTLVVWTISHLEIDFYAGNLRVAE